MIEKLFSKIIHFKNYFLPRYRLSLDCHEFVIKHKKNVYKFKVFNEFNVLALMYEEILENKHYLYEINPFDLIKIASLERDKYLENSQLDVVEFLRNNTFKIRDGKTEGIFKGHEICNNPLLMERMKKTDIHKIAYMTGFSNGRELFKDMIHADTEVRSVEKKPLLYVVK